MKKIPKRLLLQLDILFFLMVALLVAGWMTGLLEVLLAAVAALAAYVWTFYRFKCPHCRRNIMPWTAAKAKVSEAHCPHCGFKLEVG